MGYIGSTPTTQNFISGTDYFNGNGSTTAFTLTRTIASVNDIQVVVNNVVQQPNSGYTVIGSTLTFDQAPSTGTNNIYVRYLSTTTQAITPSQGTVNWNTLDSNIQQDLGVMYKNKIINGNMVIDQRNAGASVTNTTANIYTLDRWACFASQASKFTVQQNAGSVTPPNGYINYLGCTSSAATSVGSGDYFQINQSIEGLNISDLNWGSANAKTVTISFWVRSSLTGTFGGSLRNSAADRSYPFTYTISAANTWEQKSITVVGDTTGTWLTTNGIGIRLVFSLGMGSTFSATAGSWQAGNFASATGATSVVGTNGATFYITGVQLEVGTQATAFSTAGGSYGAELALCQRYYEKSFNTTTVPAENIGATQGALCTGVYSTSANAMLATATFAVEKRAAPTITTFNPYAAGSGWSESGAGNRTATLYGIGTRALTLRCDAATSAVGNNLLIHWTASIEL